MSKLIDHGLTPADVAAVTAVHGCRASGSVNVFTNQGGGMAGGVALGHRGIVACGVDR